MTSLFDALPIGDLSLHNRILMAPLTRCRAEEGHLPTPLMAEYYRQRASAGLIVTEATMVMENASVFGRDPGIYSPAQRTAWQLTTDAVHAAGGRVFSQIWHGGRACHPLLNQGVLPIAPSAIAITDDMVHTPEGKKPYAVPRVLEDNEIPAIVASFQKAAENAKAAGFDGVEVHSANGYLLDTFLRDGSNQRTGPYGGSLQNRARLLFEVLEAVCGVLGHDRVGVRISPLNSYNSMKDSDPIGLSQFLAKALNAFRISYLHVMRGDFAGQQQGDVLTPIRAEYKGVLIGNMGYSGEEATAAVRDGKLDAVAFGMPFLTTPDLPARMKIGAPFNAPRPEFLYSPGPEGYTDYPTL